MRHLLRRYGVETLFCWNGCSWFYDEAPGLPPGVPLLQLTDQFYKRSGGWIAHYRPSLVHVIDCHVAVNRRIARALAARGVSPERIRLIYHGVELPGLASGGGAATPPGRTAPRAGPAPRCGRGRHVHTPASSEASVRQNRPFDVVRLARRMSDRQVHFVIAGGGPLEEALERELAAHPPSNLVRLPMQRDPQRLYDAVDVCLLTSSYEGLPVFLFEGLAGGLPCVATAVGDLPCSRTEVG